MTPTFVFLLLALPGAATAPRAVTHALLEPAINPWVDDDDELAQFDRALSKLGKLRGSKRESLLAQVRQALEALDAPQVEMVAKLVAASGLDREELPAPTEAGPHDPERWIGPKRKKTRAGSSRWRQIARQISAQDSSPPRQMASEVHYEWATGSVVRITEKEREGETVWRNLLHGFHPDQDLAEAWIQLQLDGEGPLRKQAEFFSHDYADLKARYYEGLSLFEVWSHAIPNDVPDVDARAFGFKVHDEELPVPLRNGDKQRWYPKIREAALSLLRHRRAAEAVAAIWLQAEPRLPQEYSNANAYLQAFAARHDSQLAPVLARFQAGSFDFIEAVRSEIEAGGGQAYGPGAARQAELRRGREAIRAAALEVLTQAGYLEG